MLSQITILCRAEKVGKGLGLIFRNTPGKAIVQIKLSSFTQPIHFSVIQNIAQHLDNIRMSSESYVLRICAKQMCTSLMHISIFRHFIHMPFET